MRNANSHVWISAIACALALTAPELPAQLPPDVQVDRLSLRAERQIGSEEYGSALESLDEILRLQAEHDLTLPESFWFRHAVASNKAGLFAQAAESATRYVESTGRGGEHYLEALELLDVAEAAAERQATEASELAARLQEAQLARRAAAEAAVVREAEMSEVAVELAELAPEMQMVVIPAGSFRMGCLSVIGCRDSETPVREVTISAPFAVSKHEVTFRQWDACVASGGCSKRPYDSGWGRGQRPVMRISWDDAQEYVRWLSDETGATYRLLTEAEWEYAARAGSSTAYGWGNRTGSGRANCDGCGSQWDDRRTAPVGSFPSNVWGLHDMHGNVAEWVEDCWHSTYSGAPSDGGAWLSGECIYRVVRGGYWGRGPGTVRSASRDRGYPDVGLVADIGFRVARTLSH